jgi:hypothetical protein
VGEQLRKSEVEVQSLQAEEGLARMVLMVEEEVERSLHGQVGDLGGVYYRETEAMNVDLRKLKSQMNEAGTTLKGVEGAQPACGAGAAAEDVGGAGG